MKKTGVEMLDDLLRENAGKIVLTFSRNCISGIAPDCRCRRCLSDRGEPWDKETEKLAAERSAIETQRFRLRAIGKEVKE